MLVYMTDCTHCTIEFPMYGIACVILAITVALRMIFVLTIPTYVVCPKSKYTVFLFKCLLESPEITRYLFQSMILGKLHSGSNVFSTDHSRTGSHFP